MVSTPSRNFRGLVKYKGVGLGCSRADNDAVAAGRLLVDDLVNLGVGIAVGRVVGEAAAGTTAVELDAVTSTGDSVAFAGAAGAGAGDAGRGAGVGRAGGERWNIGVVVGVEVAVIRVEGGPRESGGKLLKRLSGVLAIDDLAGLVWAVGLGGNDPGGRERAALGDGGGADWARAAGRGGGLSRGALGWDVEDVELAASGGLGGVRLGGVVRDVVAVNDVVVPVSLALLESGALELEVSDPSTGFLGVLGERELPGVVVPRAEQVDRLAVAGSAESEVELDSGHF
jgi:hypothetical protein